MGKDLLGNELGRGFSQRKDGRYIARANVNGADICIYDTDLEKLKDAFESAKFAARCAKPTGKESCITVGAWFEQWFENIKKPQLKTEHSAMAYKRLYSNKYGKKLNRMELKDLRQMDIQMATNELVADGYKYDTVHKALSVLSQLCEAACANKLIISNPCVGIHIANYAKMMERRVLTLTEEALFLSESENSYYKELYYIMLNTGMRIGEIGGLHWCDIDWMNKCIKIERALSIGYLDGKKYQTLVPPKTVNSYRSIPFINNVEKALLAWKQKQDSAKKALGDRWRAEPELGDLVFTTSLGSPIVRYNLQRDLDTVVQQINAKAEWQAKQTGSEFSEFAKVSPHAFRHTFATRCFENGLTPLTVQSIMGHANYQTTIGYTHVLSTQINKELTQIGWKN